MKKILMLVICLGYGCSPQEIETCDRIFSNATSRGQDDWQLIVDDVKACEPALRAVFPYGLSELQLRKVPFQLAEGWLAAAGKYGGVSEKFDIPTVTRRDRFFDELLDNVISACRPVLNLQLRETDEFSGCVRLTTGAYEWKNDYESALKIERLYSPDWHPLVIWTLWKRAISSSQVDRGRNLEVWRQYFREHGNELGDELREKMAERLNTVANEFVRGN